MAKSTLDMLRGYEKFRGRWKNTGRYKHLNKVIAQSWVCRLLLESRKWRSARKNAESMQIL